MLELTKLKVANGQLEDALKEINEATHRYLFWTSDVSPIGFSWPLEIVQDLRRLISLDTISELGKASAMMLTSKETLLPLCLPPCCWLALASVRGAISPAFSSAPAPGWGKSPRITSG